MAESISKEYFSKTNIVYKYIWEKRGASVQVCSFPLMTNNNKVLQTQTMIHFEQLVRPSERKVPRMDTVSHVCDLSTIARDDKTCSR